MNNKEKNMVIERYNKRLQEFGYSPKTLGWSKSKHNLRYHILLSLWNLDGTDVLDFGCGFGDMYGYAKQIGIKFNYHGIDINENLISLAKQIYPGANLATRDVFQEGLLQKYDYIFSSGVHNLKLKDNWDFIAKTFELFNKYSTCGFALNFLSSKVDYELEETYHTNPVQILELAYKYSNKVVLRNDYMPFESTVFIDKQNDFDKNVVVYPEFIKYVSEDSKF